MRDYARILRPSGGYPPGVELVRSRLEMGILRLSGNIAELCLHIQAIRQTLGDNLLTVLEKDTLFPRC